MVASAAPTSGGSGVRVERREEGGGEGQGAAPLAATPEQLFAPLDLNGVPDIARRFFEDEASRNHFFTKLEILPGNVGYLDYDQFGFPHSSRDAADAAFVEIVGPAVSSHLADAAGPSPRGPAVLLCACLRPSASAAGTGRLLSVARGCVA